MLQASFFSLTKHYILCHIKINYNEFKSHFFKRAFFEENYFKVLCYIIYAISERQIVVFVCIRYPVLKLGTSNMVRVLDFGYFLLLMIIPRP